MIDLHMHSTFSDGSLTPEELVEAGKRTRLTAMSLTDHDCMDGLSRFMTACDAVGIVGIPGVEISAEVGAGTMHVLGYYVAMGDADLEGVLRVIRDGREDRNVKILERLNELGCHLEWDEVAKLAGEDVVGRPHFAQAMQSRGYVSSKQEAFDMYLAKGKQAYVDRTRQTPEDSIGAILAAGGVPVLSHPFTLGLGRNALKEFVGQLTDMGLGGIEVYYSEHAAQRVQEYLELTKHFDLQATGGTDFHGDVNPAIRLGYGFGSLKVPDEIVGQLQERAGVQAVIGP